MADYETDTGIATLIFVFLPIFAGITAPFELKDKRLRVHLLVGIGIPPFFAVIESLLSETTPFEALNLLSAFAYTLFIATCLFTLFYLARRLLGRFSRWLASGHTVSKK